MLLSMTGFGEARHQSDAQSLNVEIRSVNNRYLKISLRTTEPYNLFEPELERLLRKTVRRGTLQIQIRGERQGQASDYRINLIALRSYLEQVQSVANEMGLDPSAAATLMAPCVGLPGVASEPGSNTGKTAEEWQILERTVEQALDRLQLMRREEGRRMADELLAMRRESPTSSKKSRNEFRS